MKTAGTCRGTRKCRKYSATNTRKFFYLSDERRTHMVWARGSSQSYSQIKKGKGGYINMANGGAGALSYDQTGKYERAVAGSYGTEHSKGGVV